MVKNKDMQFFMENLKMKRKRGKKIWPSLTGIWTPDFSTNSRPKFEIWGRLDLSSPGFLELLDFTVWIESAPHPLHVLGLIARRYSKKIKSYPYKC